MFLFCSFVSRPVCFKINQNAPNQLHLVSRNLFLKDEPEEVNFGTHSSVILIGCVYNSRQAAQTTAKLHGDLFQGGGGVGGGREEISLPTEEFPTASLVRHPSGSDQDRGVVDESFPFTLASGWILAPSGSTSLSNRDTARPLLCPHLQPWPHASVIRYCCCSSGPGLCS